MERAAATFIVTMLHSATVAHLMHLIAELIDSTRYKLNNLS